MSDNIIFNCIPGLSHYSTLYSGNTPVAISQAESARTYSTITLLALSCLVTCYRPMVGALGLGIGFLSYRALSNIIDEKKRQQAEEIQSRQATWVQEANAVSNWFETNHPNSWNAILFSDDLKDNSLLEKMASALLKMDSNDRCNLILKLIKAGHFNVLKYLQEKGVQIEEFLSPQVSLEVFKEFDVGMLEKLSKILNPSKIIDVKKFWAMICVGNFINEELYQVYHQLTLDNPDRIKSDLEKALSVKSCNVIDFFLSNKKIIVSDEMAFSLWVKVKDHNTAAVLFNHRVNPNAKNRHGEKPLFAVIKSKPQKKTDEKCLEQDLHVFYLCSVGADDLEEAKALCRQLGKDDLLEAIEESSEGGNELRQLMEISYHIDLVNNIDKAAEWALVRLNELEANDRLEFVKVIWFQILFPVVGQYQGQFDDVKNTVLFEEVIKILLQLSIEDRWNLVLEALDEDEDLPADALQTLVEKGLQVEEVFSPEFPKHLFESFSEDQLAKLSEARKLNV